MRLPTTLLLVAALMFTYSVPANAVSTSELQRGRGGPAMNPLQDTFAAASAEFSVPIEVLLAVSYVETLWVDHGGTPSFANGFGLNDTERSSTTAGRAVRLHAARWPGV